MRLIFKVSVEFPAVNCGFNICRAFFFEDMKEAENFADRARRRNDGTKVVGTSIDYIMTSNEATDEMDEEMEMALRVAWSETK